MIKLTPSQRFEVEELLALAGKAIMEVYTLPDFEIEAKTDFSPVTLADKQSSRIINAGLKKLFPAMAVIDEETKIPLYEERLNWKAFFLLDPLDGTKEFIKKNGEFSINLALMHHNKPVVSWIYQPVKRTGWFCAKGDGIYLFSSKQNLSFPQQPTTRKLKVATSRSYPSARGSLIIEKLSSKYTVEIMPLGSALKQVKIATGAADLYIRGSGCSEWDTAAGHLMVEESGGKVLQWNLSDTLQYNKKSLLNPPFVMLGKNFLSPDFEAFILAVLREVK